MIINSTPEYQMGLDEETTMIENKLPDTEKFTDFEEVVDSVDESTGEILQPIEPKKEEDLEF